MAVAPMAKRELRCGGDVFCKFEGPGPGVAWVGRCRFFHLAKSKRRRLGGRWVWFDLFWGVGGWGKHVVWGGRKGKG